MNPIIVIIITQNAMGRWGCIYIHKDHLCDGEYIQTYVCAYVSSLDVHIYTCMYALIRACIYITHMYVLYIAQNSTLANLA